jgi:hypothetical protein
VKEMSQRTQLQQQLEKSRRLLAERKSERDSKEGAEQVVHSSLGRLIRERNMPADTNPFDGPFLASTSDAVQKKTGTFGSIAAERIQRMRQGAEATAPMIDRDQAGVPISLDTPAWIYSEVVDPESSDSATPVWRDVLSKQRGHSRPSTSARDAHAELTDSTQSNDSSQMVALAEEIALGRPKWPSIFMPNPLYSWGNWQVGPNNRMASTAAREIITYPAERANPLLILGSDGVGKSHLLQALGSSLYTRLPDREIRIIAGGDIPAQLPDDWVDAIQGCSALLVEDIHQMEGATQDDLGKVVDYCLNLGVQVVLTSDGDSNFSTILNSAISGAVEVNISNPDAMTIVLFLRNRALIRGISLSDGQLGAIAAAASDWRKAASGFEQVAIAIEAGAEPLGVSDIETILGGEELPMRGDDTLVAWDSEQTGQKIVREVLDDVLPRGAMPNIDLVTELESKVDDYVAPNLMPESSRDAVDALIDRHLGREKSALEEARSRLEDEAAPTNLEVPRADLPHIDLMSDGFLDRLESRLQRHQDELFSLHNEMETIAGQLDDAEPKELVAMADRMLEIERELSRISRLDAGEALKSRKKPSRPYEPEIIEEYVPEGEWDIDEESISADDLLEPKAVLRPIKVLKPIFLDDREGEEE